MTYASRTTTAHLLLADSAAGLLALELSVLCTSATVSPWPAFGAEETFFLPIPFFLACMGYFAAKGHYALKAAWWQQLEHILFASFTAFILSTLAVYTWQIPVQLAWNGLLWLFIPPCLIAMRWLTRNILVKKGSWAIPTSLIGDYEAIIKFVPALEAETYLAYDVQQAFLLDANDAQIDNFQKLYPRARVSSALPSLFPEDSYVFFCPNGRTAAYDEILAKLEKSRARFSYVPPTEGYFLYKSEPQKFFGYGVIALEPRKSPISGLSLLLKDILDKVGAAIAIVLLSPVFIILAWLIKKDGGSAVYGHKRIGKNGRIFTCLKFRSMVPNGHEMLHDLLVNNPALHKEYFETYKLKNDPRVTKIGKFLRKTSLDELPQLLNVLRGEMSLTGPRPIVEGERKFYAEKIDDYLSVRPGITGLWQVSGRSDTGYGQRVYLDSWYVKNWSLWNDIIILFKTILVVVMRKGAY